VVTSILLTTGKGLPANSPIEVMAPNGNLFYSQQTSIPVISTSSNQVVQTLAQNFSHLPAAITPDGNFLYMAGAIGGNTLNEVAMIDSASGSVVGTQIPLSVPVAVAIAPNGQFAYVIAEIENGQWGVYVVDISSS
jgi:DNA-binding beta-propeller fold protein YncE